MYDLPYETNIQIKAAMLFRKNLLQDGFSMFQYSVYIRYGENYEHANTHRRRVLGFLPKRGNVIILQLTDKQFSQIDIRPEGELPEPPEQVTFF